MHRLGLAFHSCLAAALAYLSRFLGPVFKIGNKVNDASVFGDNLASTRQWSGTTYRKIQAHPEDPNEKRVSWALEASGEYSTRPIYLSLSQGAAVTHFRRCDTLQCHPKLRFSCGG
jgi:hypothetical protein